MRILSLLILGLFTLSSCIESNRDELTDAARRDLEAQANLLLNSYYEAVEAADFERFISFFTQDAFFYGTDVSEAWPREEFAPSIEEAFATGTGWDFDLHDRQIHVADGGETAWFVEQSYFNNTGYMLRPSGILIREGTDWKIGQIIMGVPLPNELYWPALNAFQALDEGDSVQRDQIDAVLNSLHEAASKADAESYFSLFTEDAVYIGTDASERWTMPAFRQFAAPYFESGKGWTYNMQSRYITLGPMKNVAWFDEILTNESYGTTRGTGTMVRTQTGWKIAHYHLTIPVPNELARPIAAMIRTVEEDQ